MGELANPLTFQKMTFMERACKAGYRTGPQIFHDKNIAKWDLIKYLSG